MREIICNRPTLLGVLHGEAKTLGQFTSKGWGFQTIPPDSVGVFLNAHPFYFTLIGLSVRADRSVLGGGRSCSRLYRPLLARPLSSDIAMAVVLRQKGHRR